jgi:hypothetical protein
VTVQATDAASVRLHPTSQVIDPVNRATAVSDYSDGSRLRLSLAFDFPLSRRTMC